MNAPIEVRLACPEPFDGGSLIEFFAHRAVPGVEEVVDGAYRRSVRLAHGAAVVSLRPTGGGNVDARLWLDDARDLDTALERCGAALDIDCDPGAVLDALGLDDLLGTLVRAAPGRRVPGHVDGDELAVRAVLGQQVSVAGARTLAARLVSAYGTPLRRPLGGVTHLFPTAERLADADPAQLAMPASRRRAVLGLAAALASGSVRLERGGDGCAAVEALLALPGIGPWTASYVSLRALGDSDAFIETDLGVRHAIASLGRDARPRAVLDLAEAWRPYRAYGVVHLWAHLTSARGAMAA
jgi:AraC family transcriptional regulator of adaptative response / DNA-3-methyladenine glycosylase II